MLDETGVSSMCSMHSKTVMQKPLITFFLFVVNKSYQISFLTEWFQSFWIIIHYIASLPVIHH